MGLDRSPDYLIKTGLAALKQKDYERAIATFTQLSQADGVSTNHRLKAQMGLIRTYEAQGANIQAQTLCKSLLNSHSQAIRQWAHDKLKHLETDQPSLKRPNSTPEAPQSSGFVPESSGFIPFNDQTPTVNQTPPSKDSISSPDIQPTLAEDVPSQSLTHSEQTIADSRGLSNQTLNVQPQSTNDLTHQTVGRSSLFHYETLNTKQDLSTIDTGVNQVPKSTPTAASTPQQTSTSTQRPKPQPPKQQQSLHQKQQDSPTHPLASAPPPHGPDTWPQGTRLRALKSLGKVSKGKLWFAQITTIPILFLVIRWSLKTSLIFIRGYLQFLDRILPINIRPAPFFWGNQTWTVLIGLGLLTLAAPWLWALLLRPSEQITHQQLQNYSPEAAQLLRRLCTNRRWKFPTIQLIDSELAVIFSYGWQPRVGQLVVSQGLLDRLQPDELAAIIMYEISHWPKLDWILFSGLGLLLQGCHRVYWFLARHGEHRPILIQWTAGTLATLSYCMFWLLAKIGCSLARIRTPYRDRIATELTGNPNGLVRALAKLSQANTEAIAQQGYTPPLLESLDLMLPVGLEETGTSVQQYAWGAFNPLRHWLSINQAHPPLGDRLYTLGAYGRHWRLKPSLNFAHLTLKNRARILSAHDWQELLSQGGGWSGLIVGLGVAGVMWLIGAIATSLDFPLLDWLYKDRSILIGIPLICAATGQLLRINPFFPEISNTQPKSEAHLTSWQKDPTLIPLSHRPVTIKGTLTGRPALANWLGQEWRLRTPQNCIKLHYTNHFGPLGNIKSLTPWLQQSLQVTGWFRRGHHLWIDIDRLQNDQNQIKIAQHPIWATISSLCPLAYGLWLIFKGG
ncbi:hypothetical protein D0962_09190 [Leptolyngbyaceae cyanobacterium CCMR0082]|uniref:Peptidase M48 domain-containing protein n=1 Tax=Adonisia turfae CCMR0082 TaxID=2304604 RepID=A0A6M0S3J6_9CYAN|nr:zinc metalloprotease HtpX [Adonisia turfae]NEZ62955.1 hypothetical protein [Adonisia turfae CCMR0082]